jgi:ABC-type nitrate/sulfonate/bicarbonate transport system substrate-binding protein
MSAASRSNIGRRALKEQRITNPDDEVVELPPDILVPAVHGQRIDPVAPAQAQIAEAPAHHAGRRA